MRGRIFESLMHLLLMKIVPQNSILCRCDCQKNVFPGQLFGVRCSTAFLWVYNHYFLVQIKDFVNYALNFCPELGHLRPAIAGRRFELESRDNIETDSRYSVLDQQICCTRMCIWKWLFQFLLLQCQSWSSPSIVDTRMTMRDWKIRSYETQKLRDAQRLHVVRLRSLPLVLRRN